MADNSKWKGKNLSYMTPAMMHAMKMSQMQSQNTYKEKYNQEVKGKGFTGAETMDAQRAKKMTKEQSLLKYHADFEKGKGKGFTAVSDTPEMSRIKGQQNYRDVQYKKEFFEQKGHNIPVVETPESIRIKQQQKFLSDVKYQEDRNKLRGKATQVIDDPNTRRAMQAAKIASDIAYKKTKEKQEEMEVRRKDIAADQPSKAYKHVAAPGSVLDYDPVARMQNVHIQDKSREETVHVPANEPVSPMSPTRANPEPVPEPEPVVEPYEPEPQEPAVTEEPQVIQEITAESLRKGDGHKYRAMYDYVAQDDDEVTFSDGDVIINAQKIDDGWMFGTVERTGQTGMLPSNYVEVAQ